MQRVDDAFWKKRRRRPTRSVIKAYESRAAKARQADLRDRLGLATLAWRRNQKDLARKEYETLIRNSDAPLDFDAKGRIRLGGGTVPAEVAVGFRDQAVEINGKLYLRDGILSLLPEVDSIQEKESASLRVRGIGSAEQVADLHALGEALLPHLETAVDGRPVQRMNLFVFPDRATYESYLDTTQRPEHKAVSGFAQRYTMTAVVCAEGKSEADLQALVLHELTHLFTFGVSRAVMPSWYSEGFAEVFGGQGTFSWDGKNLTVGGRMAAFRMEPLLVRANRYSLEEVLGTDALSLFAKDPDRALVFYAQSWALVFFLRKEAGPGLREQFADWEVLAHGAALGAEVGNPFSRNITPASDLFRQSFAQNMPELESAFHAWLDQTLSQDG